MKFKFFVLSFCLTVLSWGAHAGTDVQNGGDGIEINGKLYLLDLVEAGVEDEPYYDWAITNDPEIEAFVKTIFQENNFSTFLLAKKLTEIRKVSPEFANALLWALESYNWRSVNLSLVDVKDEDSALDYDPTHLRQLAVRSGRSIRVDKNLWKQLNLYNQTALIFHEVIYSLITPVQVACDPQLTRLPEKGCFTQQSGTARDIVGYIFTPEFSRRGYKGLERLLLGNATFFSTLTPPNSLAGPIWLSFGEDFPVKFVTPHHSLLVSSTDEERISFVKRFCATYFLAPEKYDVIVSSYNTHKPMVFDHYTSAKGLPVTYLKLNSENVLNVLKDKVVPKQHIEKITDCEDYLLDAVTELLKAPKP